MAAARPAPTTPRKPRVQSVEDIIVALNDDYNVDIPLPDSSLTPSYRLERAKYDTEYGRRDRIYKGIHFLYHKREGELERTLRAFHYESKAASQNWLPKPSADPDVLPCSSGTSRADTPGEILELQTILLDTIERMMLSLKPSLSGRQTTAGVSEVQTDSFVGPPRPSRPKRSSHEGLDGSTKRVRSHQAETNSDETQELFAAIDKVPVRHKATARGSSDLETSTAAPNVRLGQKSFNGTSLNTSLNTSKVSMVTSVFSVQDPNGVSATQSTVEANINGTQRTVPVECSQDSLMPSSDVLRALDESFNHIQSAVDENPGTPRSERVSGSVDLSTGYTEVFEMQDVLAPNAKPPPPIGSRKTPTLGSRLQSIWPAFPPWLCTASMAVAWEITRIAVHCNVDLNDLNMRHDPLWDRPGSLKDLRKRLYQQHAFRGKSFPEAPNDNAWDASFSESRNRDMVAFSMSIDFNPSRTGPLFLVQMHPAKLDKGYRLNRHFGPSRFLELLMPSLGSRTSPLDEGATTDLIRWLTRTRHSILGREWAAFFTSDAGYKSPPKELRMSPEAKPSYQDRVYLFAESGVGLTPRSPDPRVDTRAVPAGTAMSVNSMLDWLLNFSENKEQPYLKLFSRIKLGLSKTQPSLVFEPQQIHHHKSDIKSLIKKTMNDGVARMSLSVARKIRDDLVLDDIPSAIQGRLGSAKGMWVIDVTDDGLEDWIETFPSQRKWECNQNDPDHRTLEVHSVATELTSASLNLQFLPVLEDRAENKQRMRDVIAEKLVKGLKDKLGGQRTAMKGPLHFKSWLTENTSTRHLRVQHGQVPFLGGLPDRIEDAIVFLLDGGFDPRRQLYLQELSWKIQEKRCDQLKTKLNINVGCSAYIYMIVDFMGVLEEGEVHVGFSTKFQADSFSGTLLHGIDVLVARSPAHFNSDIQKVRAVFKPELQSLRDVIVFSKKGNIPLADKLSGGDYDGDRAWVCWDPDIVNNFVNAEVPKEPDLSDYITKDEATFGALEQQGPGHTAIAEMIEHSFRFNMRQSYLGICTNYKEKMCYQKNKVDDEASVILSTLLGKLVDQAKQGIVFGQAAWDRLCKERLCLPPNLPDPAYKRNEGFNGEGSVHIIDWLKFSVAIPTIKHELTSLHQTMKPSAAENKLNPANGTNSDPTYWDPDLVEYYNDFVAMVRNTKTESGQNLLDGLKDSIDDVYNTWTKTVTSYTEKVDISYQKWCSIAPVFKGRSRERFESKVVYLLTERYVADPELSHWALLKASCAFKHYYKRSSHFIWCMAGRQLQFMKAMVSQRVAQGGPVVMTPTMYAGVSLDKKFVKQFLASLDGTSTDYMSDDDDMEDDT